MFCCRTSSKLPRTLAAADVFLTIGSERRRPYPKRVTGASSESGIANPLLERDL